MIQRAGFWATEDYFQALKPNETQWSWISELLRIDDSFFVHLSLCEWAHLLSYACPITTAQEHKARFLVSQLHRWKGTVSQDGSPTHLF